MDTRTVGNQNPWAPYESYRRECSQGICSVYCPQWCYVIYPPPPFDIGNDDDDGGSTFSPLIIAIIGVLVSAFLLVCYYTIITKYCRRRNNSITSTANGDVTNHDQWQDVAQSGLDDKIIKSITVCKYQKGDGLIEGTECAVCLSEFQENENLRLLPKCTHAFHLPCIDTWLKTNTNCPLCRSSATPTTSITTSPTPAPNPQTSSTLNISSLEMQRQSDLVLVVEDGGGNGRHGEGVIRLDGHGDPPKENTIQAGGTDQENVEHFMRSISLGTFSSERNLLIADILNIDEEDDGDLERGNVRSQEGIISSSQHPLREQRKLFKSTTSVEEKRNVSSGRFIVKDVKGKNPILPN
ncbi:hypothetical protein Leryth_022086 [Lithospermum erythrorhizon]|nr:hypothetical protein Leryth_022086 [Lithospermum erythrorhizon]